MDDREREMLLNHEHRLNHLGDNVEDLRETVYGCNESPGLRIQVDRLNQSRLSDKDRRALYVAPVVSGLIIAVASVVATGSVTWLMK